MWLLSLYLLGAVIWSLMGSCNYLLKALIVICIIMKRPNQSTVTTFLHLWDVGMRNWPRQMSLLLEQVYNACRHFEHRAVGEKREEATWK